MSGKRNREEGHKWERECAEIINTHSLNGKLIPIDEETGKLVPVSKLPEEYFELFPKIGTCRQYNRALDAQKVDLTTVDPRDVSKFGYLIQNKSLVGGAAPYPVLLTEMSKAREIYGGVPVVFHKQTEKREQTNGKIKFFELNRFAITHMEDFIDMVVRLKKLELKIEKYETKIDRSRS